MSRQSKPLNLARLNDATLGAFGLVPSSETLDHLVRYLSTWSGSDKLFMIIQYTLKLLIPLLHARAGLQHRYGYRKDPVSGAAVRWAKIGGIIGSARMLWRIWGLLPIFQWLISLERTPPPTRRLLTIERIQGWAMLGYYPLEHISYLRSNDLIPATIPSPVSYLSDTAKPIEINAGKLGMWSCRFWAFYVVLQFAHLREDRKLLQQRERTLKKGKMPAMAGELEDLSRRWDSYWNEMVVNMGNLPLTIHWSLEQGIIKNDVWVGVFGLIGALASFRSGWRATALPKSAAPALPSLIDDKSVDLGPIDPPAPLVGYDASS
ncbi:hypothetical protein FIBSPDRAFT_786864 [Athelia psychrophila]|uniref:Uncharacterized protein n=1 Tax=Athelia psychrophila TaxID=1759441 RepID=A0A166LCF9_9AGAM|nr:hypothetical protein FIBSPDRAFT_786864 [Fibularhizoctonia sp. CBS 109695]